MMPRHFGDAVDSEITKFTINADDINSHLQNKEYDNQYEFRETILSLTRTLEIHLLIFSKNSPIVYFVVCIGF